jgi:hypothetical protein
MKSEIFIKDLAYLYGNVNFSENDFTSIIRFQILFKFNSDIFHKNQILVSFPAFFKRSIKNHSVEGIIISLRYSGRDSHSFILNFLS